MLLPISIATTLKASYSGSPRKRFLLEKLKVAYPVRIMTSFYETPAFNIGYTEAHHCTLS
jgi:hypothetical protein